MERMGKLAAALLTATTLVVSFAVRAQALPGAPTTAGEVELRRWTGAEAGFAEIVCLSDETKGRGCLTFSGHVHTAGAVALTGRTYLDPDGQERIWHARTGNRFFRLTVADESQSSAFLRGWGPTDPFAGGTVTFAIRVPKLPSVPVVIFRHGDAGSSRAISVTLTPLGELVATTALGPLGVTSSRVQADVWNSVTMSYGVQVASRFSLAIDGVSEIDATLPAGGPVGSVDVGIVGPVSTPFVLGLDDYVESSTQNAPIAGARINYLIPEGSAGPSEWTRPSSLSTCRDAAQNWQMVSEDTGVRVQTARGVTTCSLANATDSHVGGIYADAPGKVDRYGTEGIPSTHSQNPSSLSMSGPYLRDLTAQPAEGDHILATRVRMRGYSASPGAIVRIGFVDEGTLVAEDFEVGAGSSTSLSRWGLTRPRRADGSPWTRTALGELDLHLESRTTMQSKLSIFSVRLDYVWVPA